MSVNKSLHVDLKCFCSTLSSFYITHTHAFDWRSRNPCAARHGWIRSLACRSRNSVQWLTWRSLPEEWRNCGTVENASIMIIFCIAPNVRLQIYLSGWSNAFWLLHLFALWLQCLFTPQNYSCSKNRPSSSSNVVIHQPKRSHNIKSNLSNSAHPIHLKTLKKWVLLLLGIIRQGWSSEAIMQHNEVPPGSARHHFWPVIILGGIPTL